jgi:hypothetical protein
MKRLTLLLLFFAALPLFGQSGLMVTAPLTAQASTCQPSTSTTACLFLVIDPKWNTVGATLAGTFSGTFQFEGSGDGGSTWVSVQATPSSGGSAVTSATGTGTWTIPAGGYSYIRIRCSTYTSGSATATLNPSQAVPPSGAGSGSGTVTSITFTGDGVVDSSTPSTAVTTSGTVTATIKNQSANTVLAGPSSGSAAASAFRALVGADLPAPTASTLGGIESITSASNNWIAYIDTSGVPHQSQPAFSNLSGTASTSQIPAVLFSTGTSVSLTAPTEIYVCTSTCTVTPPVPAAGYQFCVMNTDNSATVITMAALGSSARYENTARTAYGTAGTGTFTSGGAAGDAVCLVGLDSTHYLTVSYTGTWTAS